MDSSRIAWPEIIEDIKTMSVMFATLHSFNHIVNKFLNLLKALTDNGSEFGIKNSLKKDQHPFERLLMELGIKH